MIYLGTDESDQKNNVRFVISDPKNPRRRIYLKIENFEKIRTHIRVIPFGSANARLALVQVRSALFWVSFIHTHAFYINFD